MTEGLLFKLLFWLCLGGVCYAYAVYPIIIWACSRLFGSQRCCPDTDPALVPSVTVLVSARDEEQVIAERIMNGLAADYPPERIEFVVASDGSTDDTARIVSAFCDPRVRLIDFPTSRGKARVLTDVIPRLTSDIVILSDANTFIEPGAVRRIVRWLSDPSIGVVVGRLVLTDPLGSNNVDGIYWRYETFLKTCEARLGALLGANGAIYGFRRKRFQRLPPDTLVEDLVVPLLMKIETGCTIVYDADSVAHEEAAPHIGSEVRRRRRIGAGAFGSLGVLWPLMLPSHGWTAFAFVSHKVLRWAGPFLLLGAIGLNLLLLDEPEYRRVMMAQGLFYGAAAVGAWLPGTSLPARLLRLPAMFTGMNLALLLGFWNWASGKRGATWERTPRSGAAPSSE